MISIILPYPPSVNKAFRNLAGGGRARSKNYNAWRKEAQLEIVRQRPGKLQGPYKLTIEAGKPDNRKRDLDNLIKPCSDILVLAGIIRDDSDCVEVVARWHDKRRGVHVHLEAA